jgi:hypothetical protein
LKAKRYGFKTDSEIMAKLIKNISTTNIIVIALLIILIVIFCLVSFVMKYPASAGYLNYEADFQQDLNASEIEGRLENNGDKYELEYSYSRNDPYAIQVHSSDDDGVTQIRLYLDDPEDKVQIAAYREFGIPMYAIFQDLHVLGREQHVIAEKDVDKVLNTLELPLNGTYSYRDDIDSLDYIIPSTVFYVVIILFPIIIACLIIVLVLSNQEGKISRPPG